MMNLALKYLLCFVIASIMLSACSRDRGGPTPATPSPAGDVASPSATPLSSSSLGANPSPGQSPSSTSSTSSSSAVTKSGWWIRINPSGTTAQLVTFQIGTSKYNREEWRVWSPGEPTEFDVPEKYVQAPRLYVRGSVSPIGRLADVCMMYKSRGVEHMGFNDDESETKRQTDVDFKCR